MNTLTLQQLIFSGYHGAVVDEQTYAQPFEVSVVVTYDFALSMKTDNLADTIDYKIIENIVKVCIEGPSQKLIETLAGNITDAVLDTTRADMVTVTLTKLHARSVGIPSIHVEKKRQNR